MIAQDTYVYIQVGLCLRLLSNITKNDKSEIAKSSIKRIRENLNIGGFEVSLAAMKSMSYSTMENELYDIDDIINIPSDLVAKIKEQFLNLERVVFAEAITKKIYVLPSRRFNTGFLLSDPSKLLKHGSFEKLDEIAKNDFTSSCRCILFGEATAACFHILRATESVLKSYYFHHKKQNRQKKPMWGSMLDELRKKQRNKPPTSLLSSLELIRSAYRNPTQHPEATYEIDSAQDLFGVCLDVIGKMTEEIEQHEFQA